MNTEEPCACWLRTPPLPHTGHCCFGYLHDDYHFGVAPPCGHWHPDVPRPAKTQEVAP